ncbi:7479_t:CDS:2, partial [Gigaspora margarita]
MDAIKKKCVRKYVKGDRRIVESGFDGRLDKYLERVTEQIRESMNKGDENGENDGVDVRCKMDFNKEEIERDERKNIREIDIQGDEHMKSTYCSFMVDVWIKKRIILMNDYTKGLVKLHYMNQGKITKGDAGN